MWFWVGLVLFIGGAAIGAIVMGLLVGGRCNDCREWQSVIRMSPADVVGLVGPLVAATGEDEIEQARRWS